MKQDALYFLADHSVTK